MNFSTPHAWRGEACWILAPSQLVLGFTAMSQLRLKLISPLSVSSEQATWMLEALTGQGFQDGGRNAWVPSHGGLTLSEGAKPTEPLDLQMCELSVGRRSLVGF